MSTSKTRADYEQLTVISRLFAQQAEACSRMTDALRNQKSVLEGGDWVGTGATAFFGEMNGAILPALKRLETSLTHAAESVQRISREVKLAEDAAARILNGDSGTGNGARASDDFTSTPFIGLGSPLVASFGARLPASTVKPGDVETWPMKIPAGSHSTEHVSAWADEILSNPKGARKVLEHAFGDPLGPELLRQLAGWAADPDSDPRAQKAYQAAIQMYLGFYDKWDENLRGTFVDQVAAMEGPGAASVQADLARSLLDKANENGISPTRRFELTEQLEKLLSGPNAGSMVLNLAASSDSNTLEKVFTVVLKNDKLHGNNSIGEALGQSAVAIAQDAANGSAPNAHAKAVLLGRIEASAEIAIMEAYSSPKDPYAAIENGASIVRNTTKVIDYLTDGVSKPVTNVIREGVDMEVEREKANTEVPRDPRNVLREQLIQSIESAYIAQVNPGNLHSNNPEVQGEITDFREGVASGRSEKWDVVNRN